MHPSPLPIDTPPAFTVADALAHGITRRRLRAMDLGRPFHGTRSRLPLLPEQRLRLLLAAVPPQAFVCGPTAAALWGLPLSAAMETDAWARFRFAVPPESTRIRRRGVIGHRLKVAPEDVVELRGIATLSPARVWIDISRDLPLPWMLAVTDALIARRGGLVELDELAAAHRRFLGGRGSQVRERALALADDGAESPRESMVRLILVQAGLPTPECNVVIDVGGRFVARVDMLFRDARLVIEYDGDQHRDPDRWSRDQIRRAELEALGYRVTVVTRRDFDDPDALVRRIRRLLAT